MTYKESASKIAAYRSEIAAIRKKMREAQAAIEPEELPDYELSSLRGKVRLSTFFGTKPDLIVIHSMGTSCAHCTLWGDGYSGIYDHLVSRASFVMVGPDSPQVQQAFAAKRGWKFPLLSHEGTSFARDLGYVAESGRLIPGLSVLKRDGDRLLRVSDAEARPGDAFCALWHILDLIPEGANGWTPRHEYP